MEVEVKSTPDPLDTITLNRDEWSLLCEVMRTLTWGKESATPWYQMVKSVESRNPKPHSLNKGVSNQDEIDWQIFSVAFKNIEGYEPRKENSIAQLLFKYYTAGSHDEFIGRLNQNPRKAH